MNFQPILQIGCLDRDHNNAYLAYCSNNDLDPKHADSLDSYYETEIDGNFLSSTAAAIYDGIGWDNGLLDPVYMLDGGYEIEDVLEYCSKHNMQDDHAFYSKYLID